jgi:tetratricopeptide (TPR) repeat protein
MQAGKSSIDAQAVMAELDLILASRGFQGFERRRWLLRYLVERALAGADEIVESEMQAAAVEGPGAFSFGGVALPVEVRLVRDALDAYYAGDGADDALRISIPQRKYVPTFGPCQEYRPPRRLPLRAIGMAALALVGIAAVGGFFWRQHSRAAASRRLSAEATRGLRKLTRSGPMSDLPQVTAKFREAAMSDSGNAEAWAGLAESLAVGDFQAGQTREDAFNEGVRAATKAIELGGGLAAAHGALGCIKLARDWDWKGAEAELREAIRLDSSMPEFHVWLAKVLLITGQFDLSLAEYRSAVTDPVLAAPSVAQVLCAARRYDEGIAEANRGMNGPSLSGDSSVSLGVCLVGKGKYDEAAEAFQLSAARSSSTYALARLAQARALKGDRQTAEAILGQLERNGALGMRHEWAHVAMIFAGMGNGARAIDCLENAVRWREPDVMFMAVDPAYDQIRSDPRFVALKKQIGL